MAMNQNPPTPDALLTIAGQLQKLHDEWGRAIHGNPNTQTGLSPRHQFGEGQNDAWRQAQQQIGAMIESIKVARRSGIYLTDAQKQLVGLIEDRHRQTMGFLQLLSSRIYESLLPSKVEEAASDEDDGAGKAL